MHSDEVHEKDDRKSSAELVADQIIMTGSEVFEDIMVNREEIIQIRIQCVRQMKVLGTK